MDEQRPPDDALGRIVAEQEPVDRGEIGVPAGRAFAGRADLPRFRLGLGDALRRRGMRRHHVRPVGGRRAGNRGGERAPFAERGQEPRGAVGVVARLAPRT